MVNRRGKGGRRRLRRAGGAALGGMVLALGVAAAALTPLPASALAVQVGAVVEKEEVYLGESFFYQIQVTGGTQVGRPDLTGLKDFDVREVPQSWLRFRGGQTLRRFRQDEGSNYLYRLVALRDGALTIPPIEVEVDGRSYSTPAVELAVEIPPPSNQFRLTLSLSAAEAYVGEPVALTAVWYFRRQGSFYYASIPLLRHPDFTASEDTGAGRSRIPVRSASGTQYWSGQQGSAVVDGIPFTTFTLHRVVVPRKAGEYELPPGTVQVWTPSGDASGSGRHYDSTVVASGALRIRVLPLPLEGRPAGFTGLVARDLDVEASVRPEEMNVGDPVTLSITLSGPAALEDAQIPSLAGEPAVGQSFTLGPDPMSARLEEAGKVFSQTIRAKSESVTEFPALEVPYFNTRTGTYVVARSRPVPITVRPTRLVTASDLEGPELPGGGGSTVRDWEEGIRFNYAGQRLLAHRPYGLEAAARSPVVLVLLALPLALLLGTVAYTRRRRYLEAAAGAGVGAAEQPADLVKARPAAPLELLRGRLAEIGTGDPAGAEKALAAWREYLRGRKTGSGGRPPLDPGRELRRRGAGEPLLAEAAWIERLEERVRYGGRRGGEPAPLEEVLARIGRLAAALEGEAHDEDR